MSPFSQVTIVSPKKGWRGSPGLEPELLAVPALGDRRGELHAVEGGGGLEQGDELGGRAGESRQLDAVPIRGEAGEPDVGRQRLGQLPQHRQNVEALGLVPLRREEQQLGKPGRAQPREPPVIAKAVKPEATVSVDSVPAHVGRIETHATHGLHRVAEQRAHFTDLDSHLLDDYEVRSSMGKRPSSR